MWIVILLSIILCAILYKWSTKNHDYWSKRNIPHLKPLPLLGNLWNVVFKGQLHFEFVFEIYRKFDTSCVGIFLLNKPYLMVRSPELIKSVLASNFDKFADRAISVDENIDPITYHALFFSKNPQSKILRSKISAAFTTAKRKLMFPLMDEVGSNLKGHFDQFSGEVVELCEIGKKFSVDILSTCAFGLNSNCLKGENVDLKTMAELLLDSKSLKGSISMYGYFLNNFLVKLLKLKFANQASVEFISTIFKHVLRNLPKRTTPRNDFLEILNNLGKDDYFKDNPKFEIIMLAQILNFFAAGNKTTGLTFAFALYELALNPEIQRQAKEAISMALKKHPGKKLTFEIVEEITYLDLVIKETLRKYPVSIFLIREATENFEMTVDGLDIKIDKGCAVLVPVMATHFDETYYPRPDEFNPERFSSTNISPYTYLPFGGGPRICIGDRFASLSLKVGLIHILQNFSVKTCSLTEIPIKYNPGAPYLEPKNGIFLKIMKDF